MPEPVRQGIRDVRAQDVALALLVCGLMLIGTGVSLEDGVGISVPSSESSPWLPGPAGLAFVLTGSLVLAFRLVASIPVLVMSMICSLAYQAVGHRHEPLPLAVFVALYTVAVAHHPAVAGSAAAACVSAFTLVAAARWVPMTEDQYYTDLVCVATAAVIGYGVARGRARAREAEQVTAALVLQQEHRLRAAVEQEQSRIAREVHDIVAHDVSVMVAQAAAARRVLSAQPQTAADALASIEAVGRDALDGLRRLVWLLRTESQDSDRAPQPRLDRLPWLVEQVRRAGLPVEFTVLGDPHQLPATVELNAYRIVQEALTNSLKHGARTGTTVILDYRGTSLRVEVSDQHSKAAGRAGPTSADGFGLIGMQQRAALLGGELEVGPGRDAGFRVAFELPLAGADR